jgi:hypothetical protein
MRCSFFLPALVLLSSILSAEDIPPAVADVQTAGANLEVFLSSPPPPGSQVSAVLVDAGGATVATGPFDAAGGGDRAVLTGALAGIAAHGRAYRVLLVDEDGAAAGDELPFLVALRCPAGAACRFELLPGLAAPQTALFDPALAQALAELPAGTADQLAAAVAVDPSLRGAALTAAWYWAALPVPAQGCGCVWTLETPLSGGAGLVAGVTGGALSGEDGVRIEQARTDSLALRQRCAATTIRAGEAVTVAAEDGTWSTVLQIPQVVLSACPAPCTAEVSWEAGIDGRSLAQAAGPGARAEVSWEGEVTVDGTAVLQVEDEASTVPGTAGGVALRSAQWSGGGELVTLRGAARAEIAAPGEPADAEAAAALGWHFAGTGVSRCALPQQVEVVRDARPRQHSLFVLHVPGHPCEPGEPGQIGFIISNGKVCLPGRRR